MIWRELIKLHPYKNALIVGTHTKNAMKKVQPSYENESKPTIMHYLEQSRNNAMLISAFIASTADDVSGS